MSGLKLTTFVLIGEIKEIKNNKYPLSCKMSSF